MDKENVSPTITEPPSVEPSASSVGKRGDNNACRQITFTITDTNIDSPGGSGFPQSCSASLDDSKFTGLITAILEVPGSSTVTATFTIIRSNTFGVLGSLPPLFSAFVVQHLEVQTFFPATTDHTTAILGPPITHGGGTSTSPSQINLPPQMPSPSGTQQATEGQASSEAPTVTQQSTTTTLVVSSTASGSPQTNIFGGSSSTPGSDSVYTTYTSSFQTQIVTLVPTNVSGHVASVLTTEVVHEPTTSLSMTSGSTSPDKGGNSAPDTGTSRHIKPGAIAGIVIGVIAFFILAMVSLHHIRKRRRVTDVKFMMYAPATEHLTRYSSERRSSGESSGITVTYSKVVFDDPQLERAREIRRAYDYLRSNP